VPTLIGGVKIQIGDDVWDGSVRGELERMAFCAGELTPAT
jgi:F0F1-type ATP synthase delta subunit